MISYALWLFNRLGNPILINFCSGWKFKRNNESKKIKRENLEFMNRFSFTLNFCPEGFDGLLVTDQSFIINFRHPLIYFLIYTLPTYGIITLKLSTSIWTLFCHHKYIWRENLAFKNAGIYPKQFHLKQNLKQN